MKPTTEGVAMAETKQETEPKPSTIFCKSVTGGFLIQSALPALLDSGDTNRLWMSAQYRSFPEISISVRVPGITRSMYQARKDEFGKLQVREPVEISFDQHAQRRVARARLVSKLGEQEIFYTIQWQDPEKGTFAIQVYDRQP